MTNAIEGSAPCFPYDQRQYAVGGIAASASGTA